MKVRELIEKLQAVDQELEIAIHVTMGQPDCTVEDVEEYNNLAVLETDCLCGYDGT